jgi:CRP-like cAMP-binding protein
MVLFSEGDQTNRVYPLVSGKAKMFNLDSEDSEIELAMLNEGDFLERWCSSIAGSDQRV